MNKFTRALAMSGIAVAAGLTMATAPAVASPSAPSAPAVVADKKPGATHTVKYRERIHDFYRSPRTCHKVGKAGVWQKRWVRYQCNQVWRGFHRGDWALKVYYGFNWKHGNDWNHGGNWKHGDKPFQGGWKKH